MPEVSLRHSLHTEVRPSTRACVRPSTHAFASSRLNNLCLKNLFVAASLLCALVVFVPRASAKGKRRAPAGGRVAVVVDERLSALRDEPRLSGALAQRLGRGRAVALTGTRRAADGVTFYQVNVTRRTRGWLQAESFAAPSRAGDDARLLSLIRASKGFDRVDRARLFLDLFPRSPLRPEALLLYGDAAEEAATALSRTASNRLDEDRLPADPAPLRSYYLNFNGLDRFNRVGVRFAFDNATKRFHYDGAAWREVLSRYPRSREAVEARKRLESLSVALK
ncbi:MAG: hypothetical protein QOF61_1317 [Acidobacteriota bacterium]|nr:hypothetical protein [Acidobacteriota bacterium]